VEIHAQMRNGPPPTFHVKHSPSARLSELV
jgi:hypothetical protein